MLVDNRFLSHLRPQLPGLPLRYVIADRHSTVCDGVKCLLDECPDLQCVAQVSDGEQLMDTLCAHKPDILLIGLLLEGVSPLAILRQCRECMPQMGMIVLSMCRHPLMFTEIIKAGAHGFVAKDESAERLLEVILRVASGEREVFPKMVDLHETELSEQARFVLYGIASGKTADEISRKFGIGVKTVEMYRSQLFRRFGVRRATELTRMAIESGVVLNSKKVITPLCLRACTCQRWQESQEKRRTAAQLAKHPAKKKSSLPK